AGSPASPTPTMAASASECVEVVEVPPVVDKALRDVAARQGYKKPRTMYRALIHDEWPAGSKMYNFVKKATECVNENFSLMIEPASWENDGEGCCLAHGDCQINNVAFKYDKDTGRVVDCMLYDFQIMHESSPAVDLTRILLVCTDQEMREAHLDELLRGYLRDLHAHMRAGGVRDPERVFSWDLLQKHMRRTSVWPILMQPMFHSMLHGDDENVEQIREAMAKAGALEEQPELPEMQLQATPLLKQRFIDLIQDIADRGWMPTEGDLD
ncbi:EcKinase 18, partial [Frankliniella occidentalis]